MTGRLYILCLAISIRNHTSGRCHTSKSIAIFRLTCYSVPTSDNTLLIDTILTLFNCVLRMCISSAVSPMRTTRITRSNSGLKESLTIFRTFLVIRVEWHFPKCGYGPEWQADCISSALLFLSVTILQEGVTQSRVLPYFGWRVTAFRSLTILSWLTLY